MNRRLSRVAETMIVCGEGFALRETEACLVLRKVTAIGGHAFYAESIAIQPHWFD